MRSKLSSYYLAALLLLLIATFLRTYKLDQYPFLMNQDELSSVYDAYSIAETGADRFGREAPILLRGFGVQDYRPALQAWLLAIPYSFSSFNPITGRWLAAFIGVCSLGLLFFLIKRMVNAQLALVVLALAVFSPWHLLFSRMAHEGTVLPGIFLMSALWAWQQARHTTFNLKWVLLAGFLAGFSTNAYPACRITGLLLTIGFGIDLIGQGLHKKQSRWWIGLMVLGLMAFLGAFPQLLAYWVEPDHFFGRARGVLHADLSLHTFINNFWLNLSPEYLFLSSGQYNNLSLARAIPFEMPFFYLGLLGFWWLLPNASSGMKRFLLWAVIIVIIPAALTDDNPHALRASGLSLLVPIFSAVGLYATGKYLLTKLNTVRMQYSTIVGISIAFLWSWSSTAKDYLNNPQSRNLKHQYEVTLASQWLKGHVTEYDSVYVVEPFANQAYIYLAAFGGMTPQEFQQAPKQFPSGCECYCTQLGPYAFVTDSVLHIRLQLTPQKQRTLVVTRQQPLDKGQIIHKIDWEGHEMYFYEP